MGKDFVSRLKATEQVIDNAETWPSVAFSNIVHRARILLMSRSDAELNAIAVDIREIIEEYDPLIDEASCEIWEKYEDSAPTRHSIPQSLRFCVGNVSLEERRVIANPKWSEYFAVLALDGFSAFIESVVGQADIFDELLDDDISCHLACLLSYGDAHEAITMAESLDEDARLSSEIGQLLKAKMVKKTSDQNKKNAKSKHKKTKALLRKLVFFYQNGEFKSMKAAVLAFIAATPGDEYNHLAPTNLERTLYNGLSDVLNGKRQLE
ncbi:MAG: hypothetical protein AB2558_11850 [Candidatus Thiodiazotropha sp.]